MGTNLGGTVGGAIGGTVGTTGGVTGFGSPGSGFGGVVHATKVKISDAAKMRFCSNKEFIKD
jgi:hypothetical protein